MNESIRLRAYEISVGPEAGTPDQNWYRAERELTVAHDYDTPDRDLERLGLRLSRLPSEAGVVWRLTLPRGELVEAWEAGVAGLAPPGEIAGLIEGVVAGKALVGGPPLSSDKGAIRLRELLEAQRLALLAHEPGTRLGEDPENLHQHRVAARRARALLRATRAYVDPGWQRSLAESLARLGEVTGPVRDLDILLEHLNAELGGLAESDRDAAQMLVARIALERESARRSLIEALDGDAYRRLLARLRVPPRLADGVGAVPLARIARKEFRRLADAVDRLGKHPQEDAIHRLRISLKRARYAAELSVPGGDGVSRFLADAKALQDVLGEHQDAVVAEERLRATAVVDLQTAVAFVAGRLAERQQARREHARERLPAAWKRLRKSGARFG